MYETIRLGALLIGISMFIACSIGLVALVIAATRKRNDSDYEAPTSSFD